MKKNFIITLLLALCSVLHAQVPSVAGVDFGSDYETAKAILDRKFNNGKESYQFESNEISYNGVFFAGEYFGRAEFYFKSDGERSYLEGAYFYKLYDLSEAKEAKAQRDRLYETYIQKYPLKWNKINNDGYKLYVLGDNYFRPEDGFIVIATSKEKNKLEQEKLSTSVYYNCNGFVSVDDEI